LEGPRGVTPPCLTAKFKINDVVRTRRLKHLGDLAGRLCAIAAVVPPSFSPDWALADLRGSPRPLMAEVGRHYVTYLVVFEGERQLWLIREAYLLPTGKPAANIVVERHD
jgi:hypothetical protein